MTGRHAAPDFTGIATAARQAGDALATLGPALQKATAPLSVVATHAPPPGPARRAVDRLNLWAGVICTRPDCDRQECRQARARREATGAR